ncbi:MAG: prepilin-type N-terminal cleavage/methylation domain-containing protein [Phycisphaerales bacterium]|nr:prepilin-type N-terminal cleavage/methylation domain-containing protein [Phycisphaerales bacterium]
MSKTNNRAAFTLIELLVVIGIISLLISIMTPSLSRARQQAKSTVCLSRLNELMKGVIAYSSDHEFALPLSRFEVRPQSNVFHGWAELIYADLYQDRDFRDDANFPVMHNLEGRYELFACKEAEPRTDHTGHYRVYELSWSRGSLDKVKARLPLIMDANPRVTLAEDLLRADIPRERIAGLQGEAYVDERHYGGANFAYNDGHAERSTQLKEKLAEDWDLDPRTPNE